MSRFSSVCVCLIVTKASFCQAEFEVSILDSRQNSRKLRRPLARGLRRDLTLSRWRCVSARLPPPDPRHGAVQAEGREGGRASRQAGGARLLYPQPGAHRRGLAPQLLSGAGDAAVDAGAEEVAQHEHEKAHCAARTARSRETWVAAGDVSAKAGAMTRGSIARGATSEIVCDTAESSNPKPGVARTIARRLAHDTRVGKRGSMRRGDGRGGRRTDALPRNQI